MLTKEKANNIAKEAEKIAKSRRIQNVVENISNQIERAALDGKYEIYVTIDNNISSEVVYILCENGFAVTKCEVRRSEFKHRVSWED